MDSGYPMLPIIVSERQSALVDYHLLEGKQFKAVQQMHGKLLETLRPGSPMGVVRQQLRLNLERRLIDLEAQVTGEDRHLIGAWFGMGGIQWGRDGRRRR